MRELPKVEVAACVKSIGKALSGFSQEVQTAAMHAIFSQCLKEGIFKFKPVSSEVIDAEFKQ
jgi:hypothetical protein